MAWFNQVLRTAAHQIQVVFITCRPGELLTAAEFPANGDAMRTAAGDHLRAVDLTKVIQRFAAAPPEPARRTSDPPPVERGEGER